MENLSVKDDLIPASKVLVDRSAQYFYKHYRHHTEITKEVMRAFMVTHGANKASELAPAQRIQLMNFMNNLWKEK